MSRVGQREKRNIAQCILQQLNNQHFIVKKAKSYKITFPEFCSRVKSKFNST